MRVEELMTRQVMTCGPDETLDRAAQLMWDGDCGCIPVCVGDGIMRAVGMITDRDICMSALFAGKPLHQLRVSEAMAREVRSCKAGDSVRDAERVMREARIRRLPVLNEAGGLVGLIALADVAREAAREQTAAKPDVTEGEVGDTLASICEPPVPPSAHPLAA